MPWIFNYSHLSVQEVTKLLGNAPLCALPATLESYRLAFKGHSRKWGGALATIEKKRKGLVYGSAFMVYPEELKAFASEFPNYEMTQTKVTLTTGDTVKAHVFEMPASDEAEGTPGKDYAKAITKHLRFFWDSGEGQKLKLEDFIYAPSEKADVAAPAEAQEIKELKEAAKDTPNEAAVEEPQERSRGRGRGRPRGAKNKPKVTKE